MNSERFEIRKSKSQDLDKVLNLYRKVSKVAGGLARTEKEITKKYIKYIFDKSQECGIQFVIVDKLQTDIIVAEIHCYKLAPAVFSHIFSDLTIAVDKKYQDEGLGTMLFKTLLHYITENRKDIYRVELIVRESNKRAIHLYEKLGFKIEGRLDNRIKTNENSFEADIPMAWFNPNFIKE
jgi:ribosomal protein S18 acetylase RimI-like enzyme